MESKVAAQDETGMGARAGALGCPLTLCDSPQGPSVNISGPHGTPPNEIDLTHLQKARRGLRITMASDVSSVTLESLRRGAMPLKS